MCIFLEMPVYFFKRCAGGPKSKDFWPSIKPFLSKKGEDDGNEVLMGMNCLRSDGVLPNL